jgi:hypothetical protein
MMKKYLFAVATMFSATSLLVVPAGAASFITNGDFESGGPILVQGFLPSPWTTVPIGADTYSNDGSNGLLPSTNGNFTGVTAYDGIRFVAGWSTCSSCPERFGQQLVSPLVAGSTYNITGALHQAVRIDLNFPGGYNVAVGTDLNDPSPLFLVSTPVTTNNTAWEPFSVNFIAPAGVESRLFLLFIPFVAGAGTAYPGLDAFSLADANPVPLPAALPLFVTGLGALGLFGWRRKKKAAALAA